MPRAGYRQGEKRVDVWLSKAVHGHVRALAAEVGESMSEWVADLVRREVEFCGGGEPVPGVGGSAQADVGGSRPSVGGGRAYLAGVVADRLEGPLTERRSVPFVGEAVVVNSPKSCGKVQLPSSVDPLEEIA